MGVSSTRAAPNKGLLSGVVGPVESSQELSSDVPIGEEDRKSMSDIGSPTVRMSGSTPIRQQLQQGSMWDKSFLSSCRRDQVPRDCAIERHARGYNTVER